MGRALLCSPLIVALLACEGSVTVGVVAPAAVAAPEVVPIGNCAVLGREAWGTRLDQRGLDWEVIYSTSETGLRRGDTTVGSGRARVGIWNRGTAAHRLVVTRAMMCDADKCWWDKSWPGLDRTLLPGENISDLEIDARARQSPSTKPVVVSLVGSVDGKAMCNDVATWIPR